MYLYKSGAGGFRVQHDGRILVINYIQPEWGREE